MLNLTEVSLKHKALVWYFIVVVALAGIASYFALGRMEDPKFQITQMVVTAAWPGATAKQMEEQVGDKLESKFHDIPGMDYINTQYRPGTLIMTIMLRQDIDRSTIRDVWRDVRNFGSDVSKDLPAGVYGPYYNDRFDDVYGSVYAVTGDGYNYEELRQKAEKLRRMILGIDSVQKVELIGVQKEKVYVEFEITKLAELGISPGAIASALNNQNQMTPAGMIETSSDNVFLRVSGTFGEVEDVKNAPININGSVFKLGDIAKVERRFIDPMETQMYYNGQPAVGVAVSMEPGRNILKLGDSLDSLVDAYNKELSAGLEVHRVFDQPQVVEDSIADFVGSLREAVIIVLLVSFLSLGVRTGMVVACCIPLVLTAVFCGMYILGIDLHKVSLGALIISLGLLVDDAIIAVEMMSVQLERGIERFKAACFAFRATAKPMLTGTLITCAGFIPVTFAKGMAPEFCSALFPVIGMALLISWVVSVMVAPLFGYYLIKLKSNVNKEDIYDSKFYNIFRSILNRFLCNRKLVLVATVLLFISSVGLFVNLKQEFFPPSIRPELIVEMNMPEGASMSATGETALRFSKFIDKLKQEGNVEIENYTHYVGVGSPRFVLTIDPVLPRDNYAQFVIVAKNSEERIELQEEVKKELADNFPEVRPMLKLVQTGPPANYPVMLRVSGYDHDKVRHYARMVEDRLVEMPNNVDVSLDWEEKNKVIHIELDKEKIRSMGIAPQDVAKSLYGEISGLSSTQYYAGDRTIGVELRLKEADRNDISKIKNLPIYIGSKGSIPLEQLADISLEAEDGFIATRNFQPTITVQANIKAGTANDATAAALKNVEDIKKEMPIGYDIQPGGALEDSGKATNFIMVPIPAMIIIIMTLLMLQLQNIKHMVLTVLTAPLGLIGVGYGMYIFNQPMGFVALLGVMSLSGMIIRNSVILIDQIQKHLADGEKPWDAIVDSAVLRFRPIMLTAAAAILAMIPLMRSNFWGPMATAIASGLVVATVLTLLVLPVMYAEWYNVEKDK